MELDHYDERHRSCIEYAKQQLRRGRRVTSQFREFGVAAERELVREHISLPRASRFRDPSRAEFERYWDILDGRLAGKQTDGPVCLATDENELDVSKAKLSSPAQAELRWRLNDHLVLSKSSHSSST